ncbi:MAG TPA: sulfatase [Thermoanaerobaculia bacterium]
MPDPGLTAARALVRSWWTLLAGALLLGAGIFGFFLFSRRPPLNVVVVVVDTLRRDHLPTYGYARDTAPFLESLARRGVVLDGISPASWTKPATASILTGLHPVTHQALDRQDRLPEQATTLAEVLRSAGYRTLAASANGWVSPTFGFQKGFDEFLLDEQDNVRARDLNRQLLPKLRRLPEPFFLYVHYVDPHAPYAPKVGWRGELLPASIRPVLPADLDATHVRTRPADLLRRAVDLYDGEIRGVDLGLAELVGALRGRGVLGRTLLVVTADHGEEFEEHGRMSHGQTLYGEVVRVPLIFSGPGLRGGVRLGRASLIDIVPTLLDLVKIPAWRRPSHLDGLSLAGALRSGRSLPSQRGFLGYLDFVDGLSLSYLAGDSKMVLAKQPYAKQIFDLAADPGERRSLLGTAEGDRRLGDLGKAAAKLFNQYSRGALPRSLATPDAQLTADLAANGYLAAGAPARMRGVPGRIAPPDTSPDGRLGWEPDREAPACVDLKEPASKRLTLAGWYPREPGGRWTAPDATLLLGSPPGGPARLELRGINHRPDPARLRVAVDGKPVLDQEVATGPFQIEEPLSRTELSGPVLLRLATTPPFVPAQHGSADPRTLGLFFESICLR